MGNDLLNLLVQRQIGGGAPSPSPVPAVPPNPQPKLPQSAKRWANAQQIQDAYRSGWNPNPVLLRAQLGNK